jgi:hypothetical protein
MYKKLVNSWHDYIDCMEQLNHERQEEFRKLTQLVEAAGNKPLSKDLERALLAFSENTGMSEMFDLILMHMGKIEHNKRNEESWRKGIAELVKVKRDNPTMPVQFHMRKSSRSYGMPDVEA